LAIGYPSDDKVNSFKANRIGIDELLLKKKEQK
jgi:hypothetical protein